MTSSSLLQWISAKSVASEESTQRAEVRLGVHDASRVEWIVSLPLPQTSEQDYSAEVTIEIPSNVFTKHAPWDQLQELARFDGPEESPAFDASTIDGLRRLAVAVASQLTRAGDALSRHCRLAASPFTDDRAAIEAGLLEWLGTATAIVERTRGRLRNAEHPPALEIRKERELCDEYLSVRLLELLSGAERALEPLAESELALRAEDAVATALKAELAYRSEQGFLQATHDSSKALERYLDRASRLKKHFQEVLFLTAKRYAVSQRMHHVVAAFAGIIAAMGAFVLQIALIKQATASSRALTGFMLLTVVAGISYAVRDRLKEVGLSWVTGRVHRLYAQRVVAWMAPRKAAVAGLVLSVRESIDEQTVSEPDPLNPESGAKVAVTRICFTQRGTIEPARALVTSGITRVRQVFRYDLSPIFTRLDDAEKLVPVLDVHAHRVRFARAPRWYRFPVTIKVSLAGKVLEERGALVVHKRGLERFEHELQTET